MEIQGVEQIAPGWRQLEQWLNASGHAHAGQPGLEEYLDLPGEQPLDKQRFRLYLSIEV
jgi:DNA gyrase inhibitor GyrI